MDVTIQIVNGLMHRVTFVGVGVDSRIRGKWSEEHDEWLKSIVENVDIPEKQTVDVEGQVCFDSLCVTFFLFHLFVYLCVC